MSHERVGQSWPISRLLCLTLLLAAVGLLYWPGLRGQLILDDLPNLKPFEDLSSGAITWMDVAFGNESGTLKRPLSMLTLVLDYYLGDGRVFQFKLTNLVLHLLNGVALFFFLMVILERIGNLRSRTNVALLVTALWLTAPLLTSTVLYVVQRMTQLSSLLSLLGMITYSLGRLRLDRDPVSARRLILMAYLVAWPAAVLSKENGVLLPALLLLTEIFWFEPHQDARGRRFLWTIHGVFFGLPAVFAVGWILGHFESIRASYWSRDFSLSERILTQARVLWDYLQQLVLPQGLRMGITHDDFPVSRALLDPPTTLVAILGWGIVVAAVIVWRKHPLLRPLAFGIAFFLVGHSLEASVFPLELYFEHRNYLPSAGLFLGCVATGALLAQRMPGLSKWAPAMAVLPILTAFITYQRVIVWQSPEAIAMMADYAHPNSSRLQTAMISLHLRNGDMEKVKATIAKLEQIDGGRSVSHALLELSSYCTLKHVPSADEYEQIVSTRRTRMDPYFHALVAAFADQVVARRCPSVSMERLVPMIDYLSERASGSGDWILLINLARIRMSIGQLDGAIALLDVADGLDRARLEPGLIKVQLLMQMNRYGEAVRCLTSLESPERRPVKYQIEMIQSLKMELKKRAPGV